MTLPNKWVCNLNTLHLSVSYINGEAGIGVKSIVKTFTAFAYLTNKFPNFFYAKREEANDLLESYHAIECNTSFKPHFLYSHIDFFPGILVTVRDKHGRRFHQYISTMKQSY
ncbi:hypothetical protein PR048_010971 [Dryococelus australis]|uniref:Uncharacterized protein n=1 Tax=Dryococelus australis TaxID=614101 RepID=A0ABQ9HK96_9NEOP|nr:hypothetical protein PR048_010971 [Dryococelus australis]